MDGRQKPRNSISVDCRGPSYDPRRAATGQGTLRGYGGIFLTGDSGSMEEQQSATNKRWGRRISMSVGPSPAMNGTLATWPDTLMPRIIDANGDVNNFPPSSRPANRTPFAQMSAKSGPVSSGQSPNDITGVFIGLDSASSPGVWFSPYDDPSTTGAAGAGASGTCGAPNGPPGGHLLAALEVPACAAVAPTMLALRRVPAVCPQRGRWDSRIRAAASGGASIWVRR